MVSRRVIHALVSCIALLGLVSADCRGQTRAQTASAPRRTNAWPDELRMGVFLCHADHSLSRYQPLLKSLHGLQLDLQRMLEINAPRETVHLFLFQHPATYQAYIRQHFPEAPMRRALFIKDGRGPGMVFAADGRDIADDIRHEGAHAVLHSVLPMVPLWLDEGIAEYFEPLPSDRADKNPHLAKVRWAVRFRQYSTIERLEAIESLEAMGKSEYQNAWAWVHFMLHGPKPIRDELQAYFRDLQAHTPPGQLSKRLRRHEPNLQAAFERHFSEWGR